MTSNTTMNMPSNPVHTLPLISTTVASGSVSTNPPTTTARGSTESLPDQIVGKNIRGCKPRVSRPATATAAKTASTEVRPSSSQ